MPEATRQLAAIMFTDIVGYTALMGRDEQKALALLKKNKEIHERLITQYNGKLLKEIGDGILASFNSVSGAVYCAGAIQKAASVEDLNLRIGIHEGEVVFQDNDVFGDGVNIASRIEALATTGEILLSESAYKNIKNKEGIRAEFVKEATLKNIDETVRIYRVSVEIYEIDNTSGYTYSASIASSAETKPKSKSKILFASIGIALAILAGWWFWTTFNQSEKTISQSLIESRIAIIPYENRTNDPELDVLGDMAADWIIKGLMNFEDLKIVSYQNVKDHIEYASLGNWKSFSKQTGAEKIIKGSFYQQGEQLIFQSQVIDAVSGNIEFALPEIKGSKSNVEKIVNDLRQRIMSLVVIGTELDQPFSLEIERSPPTFDSYQNFQKAINLFGTDYDECRKFLIKAIALDSSYFWPYITYVFSYLNVGNHAKGDSIFRLIDLRFDKLTPYQNLWYDYLNETVNGNLKTKLTAIKKIYEKDPKGIVTNNDMGWSLLLNNKPNEAIKVYDQIDLNSYRFLYGWSAWRFSAHAHALIRMNRLVEALEVLKYVPKENATLEIYLTKSQLYILQGQQDSIQHMITKMEEDNLPWDQITRVYNNTSRIHSFLGDKESQLKWAELSLERIKKQSKFTEVAPGTETFANYLAKKYKEALPLYQDLANTQVNNWDYLSRIGIIYAKMNNRESVEDVIQELKTNDGPARRGRYKYALARIYSALNEKELATEYMKRAFNEGHGFRIWLYDYDEELVPLHGYPAYEEFVKPKG